MNQNDPISLKFLINVMGYSAVAAVGLALLVLGALSLFI